MQVPVGFGCKHLRQLGMNWSPVQKSTVKYLQIKAGLGKRESPRQRSSLQTGCFPNSFFSVGTHVSKGQISLLKCSFSSQWATVVLKQHDPGRAQSQPEPKPQMGTIGVVSGGEKTLQACIHMSRNKGKRQCLCPRAGEQGGPGSR